MKEKYFYVCDKKACENNCPNEMCMHTSNINHTIYSKHTDFDEYIFKKNGIKVKLYFEKIKIFN